MLRNNVYREICVAKNLLILTEKILRKCKNSYKKYEIKNNIYIKSIFYKNNILNLEKPFIATK